MANTRKPMSDEAREAASARMKAYHAARKQVVENDVPIPEDTTESTVAAPSAPDVPSAPKVPTAPEVPQEVNPNVTLTNEQFQMMLQAFAQKEGTAPTLNSQGGVQGVIERFPIDPRHYPNPVDELYDIPELKRFSVRENYVIDYTCTPTRYQTSQGTWYTEPRFELTLKRRQFDVDGKEVVKTDKNGNEYFPRIIIGKASFFEDPPANIVEAELAGLSMDDLDSDDFAHKMRLWRFKQWITENINPRPPQYTSNSLKEEVIGGRVYRIEEYSKPV